VTAAAGGAAAEDAAAAIAIGADLRVERFEDAKAFLAAVGEFLTAREAEHNLLLGLAGRLIAQPNLFGPDPYFAVVTRDESVVMAALRTPPHNLVLSEARDAAAIDILAQDVADAFEDLTGVLGSPELSRRFAQVWAQPAALGVSQRIYAARNVRPPENVPGAARRAGAPLRQLLIHWLQGFQDDVEGSTTATARAGLRRLRSAEDMVDDLLARREMDGGLYVWEDGEPVSICGFGSPTPTGIRVGPVYTPPDFRGRGYASAVTAEVTARALASGRRFCFLFTDLANPTSNRIYQRIGYEPVTDLDEYRFEAPGSVRP
jgi:predicted GNAT family acetyltransferase